MLGVEEELFFVDAETLQAAPGFSRVVGRGDDVLKPEVFECLAELATPPLPDAPAALAWLVRARAELARRAAAHGLAIWAAGSHPTARGDDQEIVPLERYRKMFERLPRAMPKQLVCGLHVHVAVDDPLAALEAVRPWLPRLLELSANSPFRPRRPALLAMPSGGPPPSVPTWEAWRELSAGGRRHWDAWPRPEYGTIEVRVMDQQTDVRRSAGFAAIVAAIVSETKCVSETELLSRLDAASAELARLVLDSPPEAERQLELGAEAALRDVAARTLGFTA